MVVVSMLSLSVGMYALTAHGDEGVFGETCALAAHGGEEVIGVVAVRFVAKLFGVVAGVVRD